MKIPNELRIFLVSSREIEFCPGFNFHWLGYELIPVVRIYLSHLNFLELITMSLMIKNRVRDHINVFIVSFLYGLNVFLPRPISVSYTHLRAHETPEHLVCR